MCDADDAELPNIIPIPIRVNGIHRETLIETFYERIISFSHAQLKRFNFSVAFSIQKWEQNFPSPHTHTTQVLVDGSLR